MTSSARRTVLERENAALRERLAGAEAAVSRRDSSLRFLDAMDQLHRVMRGATSVDELLVAVLDELLDLFRCDRAWLLRPCDPSAPTWRVPMERTRPEWPGAFALGVDVPMEAAARALMVEALACDQPLEFSAGGPRPVPPEAARAFHIKSQLVMAVRPKTDAPWLLGIHHCARAQGYTDEERAIFRGVCGRIEDSLGTLITLRDLAESEQRYRTHVEASPDAIVVADPAGRFVDANSSATRLFRMDRATLLTKTVADVSPPTQPDGRPSGELAADILRRCLGGEPCRFEWTHQDADGGDVPCEIRLSVIDRAAGLVRGSIQDIRERLALEGQLRHLQKMEAIGELAGGVAHDFNNQLVVILGYAGMLRELVGANARARELVGRVTRAAEDAAAITRELLAFSRRAPLAPRIVDLSEFLGELLPLLQRVVGGCIAVTLARADEPAVVRVDPSQLEQVVLNLVHNARDALPRGGHIRLGVAARPAPPGEEAPMVALTVEDDGVGMPPDVAARVFEPFFTTKALGSGTGLGLSTAYGVIRQSGGTIEVQSAVGRGTTFTVLLPLAQGSVLARPAAEERAEPRPRGGGESILLVEDNWAVSEVARQVLADGGYAVDVAGDGLRALELLQAGRRYDLLLTDVVMPGVDGVELAQRALAVQPDLRVIYSTGYASGALERVTDATLDPPLLSKPYTSGQLLDAVRGAIDRAG